MNIKEQDLSWKHMCYLSMGTIISLPVLQTGYTIGINSTLLMSSTTIILANMLLTLLVIILTNISFNLRRCPIETLALYFHKLPVKIISIIFFFSSCTWFGFQLQFISQIIADAMEISIFLLCNLFLGISLSLFLRPGIKNSLLLSRYTTLISLFFLIYIIYRLFERSGTPVVIPMPQTNFGSLTSSLLNLSAFTIAINNSLLGTVDFSSLYRLGKTKKSSFYAIIVCFGIVLSLVEILGASIALKYPDTSLINSLATLTDNDHKIFFLLFAFLSGCCTNAINLYSGELALKNISFKLKENDCFLITGLIGTIFSCVDLHNFEPIIMIKTIIVAVVLGVVCIRTPALIQQEYTFSRINRKLHGIIACTSILFGITCYQGIFHLTGCPTIDSFIFALILSLLLSGFSHLYFAYKKLAFEKPPLRQDLNTQQAEEKDRPNNAVDDLLRNLRGRISVK